ncbi:molybdopterin-binding domain-containing protein [Jiella marina]|uniref:hypothetical protein n=1 Tax=Jiella sp. LLJ827 TaxID=2917712 RepID=UPI0021018087|nr:hypothetical protein [Jiella sp. LLJ827]MCQ0990111.1 hypothetical protein [Jiella sp. LLJ827]
MDIAWIDGKPATREDALQAAAGLIGKSRQPLIAGLRTDVAGLRTAFDLARRCGGVVDHCDSDAVYPLVTALRDSGAFLGAPAEMRRRADKILIVGDRALETGGDLVRWVVEGEPDLGVRTRASKRGIMAIGSNGAASLEGADVTRIACEADDLIDLLGLLRAQLAGHRLGKGPVAEEELGRIAEFLKHAGFGCVIFAPEELGELGTEQLLGLVSDLNAETRFSTVPILAVPDAFGAALYATWSSGYPLRVNLGTEVVQHDPALYAASRQLVGGETDLTIWIDALEGEGNAPASSATSIVLSCEPPSSGDAPAVAFAVAKPGRDHDGVLYEPRFGSFVPVSASSGGEGAASDLPTVATLLEDLTAELGAVAKAA